MQVTLARVKDKGINLRRVLVFEGGVCFEEGRVERDTEAVNVASLKLVQGDVGILALHFDSEFGGREIVINSQEGLRCFAPLYHGV